MLGQHIGSYEKLSADLQQVINERYPSYESIQKVRNGFIVISKGWVGFTKSCSYAELAPPKIYNMESIHVYISFSCNFANYIVRGKAGGGGLAPIICKRAQHMIGLNESGWWPCMGHVFGGYSWCMGLFRSTERS